MMINQQISLSVDEQLELKTEHRIHKWAEKGPAAWVLWASYSGIFWNLLFTSVINPKEWFIGWIFKQTAMQNENLVGKLADHPTWEGASPRLLESDHSNSAPSHSLCICWGFPRQSTLFYFTLYQELSATITEAVISSCDNLNEFDREVSAFLLWHCFSTAGLVL